MTPLLPFPVTVKPVTWLGTGFGVTELEAADGAPKPMQLVAETLNTYAVPLVSPVTVELVVETELLNNDQVDPALLEYSILYAVMAHPLAAGAVQLAVTCVLPLAIVGALGCPGAAATNCAAEVALAVPVPTEVTALTRKT